MAEEKNLLGVGGSIERFAEKNALAIAERLARTRLKVEFEETAAGGRGDQPGAFDKTAKKLEEMLDRVLRRNRERNKTDGDSSGGESAFGATRNFLGALGGPFGQLGGFLDKVKSIATAVRSFMDMLSKQDGLKGFAKNFLRGLTGEADVPAGGEGPRHRDWYDDEPPVRRRPPPKPPFSGGPGGDQPPQPEKGGPSGPEGPEGAPKPRTPDVKVIRPDKHGRYRIPWMGGEGVTSAPTGGDGPPLLGGPSDGSGPSPPPGPMPRPPRGSRYFDVPVVRQERPQLGWSGQRPDLAPSETPEPTEETPGATFNTRRPAWKHGDAPHWQARERKPASETDTEASKPARWRPADSPVGPQPNAQQAAGVPEGRGPRQRGGLGGADLEGLPQGSAAWSSGANALGATTAGTPLAPLGEFAKIVGGLTSAFGKMMGSVNSSAGGQGGGASPLQQAGAAAFPAGAQLASAGEQRGMPSLNNSNNYGDSGGFTEGVFRVFGMAMQIGTMATGS